MIDVQVEARDLTQGEATDLTVRLVSRVGHDCTDIVFVLDFPGFTVIRGGGRIEVDRLAGGASLERVVRVRPLSAGIRSLVSKNFSYRDDYGRTHRIPVLEIPVTIRPPEAEAEVPEPRLEVNLHTSTLPLGESTLLLGTVKNTGTVSIPQARVSVSGQLAVRSHEGDVVRDLEPGASAEFSFFVQAHQAGQHVPITTTVDFADRQGRKYSVMPRHAVRVDRAPAPEKPRSIKVLFLAANPTGTPALRLDRELRSIREEIERSTFRSAFDLVDHSAVRLADLSRALLKAQARIVHFAGHGDREGHYLVEAEDGKVLRIRPEILADLFAAATDHVECVIINACHTLSPAMALAVHVPFVIGMRREVLDRAAIKFSTGFYQALSEGLPIDRAFRVGKALAEADADERGGDDVPELVTLLH